MLFLSGSKQINALTIKGGPSENVFSSNLIGVIKPWLHKTVVVIESSNFMISFVFLKISSNFSLTILYLSDLK